MEEMDWKTTLVCGVILSLSFMSTTLFAQRGGGGGSSTGGGGSGPHPGSSGGASRGSGGATHPPLNSGHPPPIVNSSPSFSRPERNVNPGLPGPPLRHSGTGAGRKVGPGHHGPVIARPAPGGVHPGPMTGHPGKLDHLGFRTPQHHSAIVNQPFTGNTVNFNNHQFHVGHDGYRPAYYRHPGYHGYWNGNRAFGAGWGYGVGFGFGYGGYGPGWGWGFGYRPFGWGLGGWGLGALYYNCGYLVYSNPYYNIRYTSFGNYNYSQPIPVSYRASATVVQSDVSSADEVLNSAIHAFKLSKFDAALDIANKGLTLYPDDAVLHEFRALVLFAKHDYQQSAATIHSVLAVGPGWDWTTLSSMYVNVAIYTEQLRALEAFTRTNPQDAASRFLLAYHYLSCGHPEAAVRPLHEVVKLMPGDRVAADVLKMLTPPTPPQPGVTTEQPSAEPHADSIRKAAKPIDPVTLLGTWTATRANGDQFTLNLSIDKKFRWSFAPKNQPVQAFGGTYFVDGNILALEREDGGSLIADVTIASGTFNLKMVGAPADDPGLDFSK